MFKFAVLPYCNAAPLVHFISEFCHSASLVEKYPREMLDELNSHRVDAALIPVVDFLSDEELRMVPGLGICANGPVESVLLQSKKSLERVKSIQLFPESRTSTCEAEHLHPSASVEQILRRQKTVPHFRRELQACYEVHLNLPAVCR